jgi:nicotinate phosphoribosyltransferase
MEIRDYCRQEQETMWEETRRLVNPHNIYVDLSQKLYDVKMELLDQYGNQSL